MKKLSAIIIAMALVLGMTQCKKNVETIAPAPIEEGVYISLKINDDSKVYVNTATGEVEYRNGDEIFVGNNGAYCGTLTYNENTESFSGTINPTANDYLYFFFVSGLLQEKDMEAATQTYTVRISSQTGGLPVLSFGKSNVKYDSEVNVYTCTLLNKCGLVKFALENGTNEVVYVSGMNTIACIDFANNSITPTGTTGTITLYSNSYGGTEKWAILLPQQAVSNPTVSISGYTASITSVPQVTENMFYTQGVNVSMTADKGFSVSATEKVYFSQGNLQAVTTDNWNTWTWRFMDYQYSIDETTDVDVNYNGRSTASLMGFNPKNRPYYTSEDYDQYSGAFTTWSGTEITNDGDSDHTWFALTSEQWDYLFRLRTNASSKYGMATVNGQPGIIVLPDVWSTSAPAFNIWHTNYNDNTIDAATWAASWETRGAAFLPAAGHRFWNPATQQGTNGNYLVVQDVNTQGQYWSSTASDEYSKGGNCIRFTSSSVTTHDYNGYPYTYRSEGLSVRLVRYAE